MPILRILVALCAVAVLLPVWQTATAVVTLKALRFGKLIDGVGQMLTNAIVVIENNRIRSVGTSAAAIPSNAEVLDLTRCVVIAKTSPALPSTSGKQTR